MYRWVTYLEELSLLILYLCGAGLVKKTLNQKPNCWPNCRHWSGYLSFSFNQNRFPDIFIVSPKSGHCLRLRPGLQRFSCVQPTSHISFWISFKFCKWLAMAEIWPPYCFGSPGVKIMFWGAKNIKNFDYCLCSSCRAQFLSELFYI